MNQLEKELHRIKEKINEMWDLVEFQVMTGKDALVQTDKELAKRVIKSGKKVNVYDLKIDRLCENFFALFNPVAIDLRWVLAILKINANLERIGDTAEGISRLLTETDTPFESGLLEQTRVLEMYDRALTMLADVRRAFDEEDTELARTLIKKDKLLNKINWQSDQVLAKYIQAHPENVYQSLKMSGIIRKLERIGDQITNIAEEIVFYVDAKVVKHKPRKKKNKDNDNKDIPKPE